MRPERQPVERQPVEWHPHSRRGGAWVQLAAVALALLTSGCAGLSLPAGSVVAGPGPQVAAAPPPAAVPPAVAPRPDLDNLIYTGATVSGPVTAVAPMAEPSVYQLDSGDRLRVVVFGQDGLSNSYIVDAAGNITMPLIGAVPARGVSTAQLAREVGARLRNGFIREPHVAIEIESYRPFFILGEVTYPGQYPFVPNMTVETAVAIAGGFTPRAYRWEAKVTRSQGGLPYRMAVPPTFTLRPGDTISIDERWF
jgi:polysaccharide biosynthesis/export protein